MYVGTFIDFISFRRQGETLSISFPIFFLGTRKEGTDIPANRAGTLQGETAPTTTPQGRGQSLPALTTQPASRKSEMRASFSRRVPELPEVIEHANLGAPSSITWMENRALGRSHCSSQRLGRSRVSEICQTEKVEERSSERRKRKEMGDAWPQGGLGVTYLSSSVLHSCWRDLFWANCPTVL